jgi:hypothetical protein
MMKPSAIVISDSMSAQEFAAASSQLKGGLWRYSKQTSLENGEMVVKLTKLSVADMLKAAFRPSDSLAARHVINALKSKYDVTVNKSKNPMQSIRQDLAFKTQKDATLAALHDYKSHDIFG